eukprot:CAMPEP_0172317262 /NCGR_PEP_ID=MMETSP1058-20130122/31070_1 /TAXON_ID=83371 /ORGANISM="Detonula confervacea, Strain CCMP 353" /LENGTH=90 /DNA_ID=CAMNT_0013031777 /DNA_START=88 /DNA_END=356 /DNA_ORIENTATION=+
MASASSSCGLMEHMNLDPASWGKDEVGGGWMNKMIHFWIASLEFYGRCEIANAAVAMPPLALGVGLPLGGGLAGFGGCGSADKDANETME